MSISITSVWARWRRLCVHGVDFYPTWYFCLEKGSADREIKRIQQDRKLRTCSMSWIGLELKLSLSCCPCCRTFGYCKTLGVSWIAGERVTSQKKKKGFLPKGLLDGSTGADVPVHTMNAYSMRSGGMDRPSGKDRALCIVYEAS